jgi:hypothetical protein
MPMNELGSFLETWDREAENTLKLSRVLPANQYDSRPDAGGRSLGELAWHLAEGDAYISYGIERGEFTLDAKPPNIARPRTVDGLAPGYERIHREATGGSASWRRQIWIGRFRSSLARGLSEAFCGTGSSHTPFITAGS